MLLKGVSRRNVKNNGEMESWKENKKKIPQIGFKIPPRLNFLMTTNLRDRIYILTSTTQLTDPHFCQMAFNQPYKDWNQRLLEGHLLGKLQFFTNFDQRCFYNRARESHIPDRYTAEIFQRWRRRKVLIESQGLFNIKEGREFHNMLQSNQKINPEKVCFITGFHLTTEFRN